PIPYKIFTIAAGVFNINIFTFIFASFIGRGMRFLLEGLMIFYLGDSAKYIISNYFEYITIGVALFIIIIYVLYRNLKKQNIIKMNFAKYRINLVNKFTKFHNKYRIVDQTAFYVYTTIVLSIFALFVFMELTEDNFIHQNYSFDFYVLNQILPIRNEYLNSFFKAVTTLGNFESIFTVSIVAIVYMVNNNHKRFAKFFAMNITLVWVFNEVLKAIFKRPRPDVIYRLVEAKGYSYPSGHAMISLAFALVFVYYLHELNKNKNIFTWFTIILALIIGISRVYLGVHYITDVLSGWAVAIIYFTTSILIYKNIKTS
ncbi:MAG: phosphatase PAP2 family protein, partial [Clostridiales bacterium]|nr:phosphatase PAP2 family protein [Clostridiales bacterium]